MPRLSLIGKVEHALGTRLVSSHPLGVGFGLDGLKGVMQDGLEIAVKAVANGGGQTAHGNLDIEGYMLNTLGTRSDLPVPEVYHAESALLIMSWIQNDGGAITPDVERHAAELLVELHEHSYPSFGFEKDTLIGPLQQPNPETDSWIRFFRDQRLLYMAHAAHTEGALSARLLGRLERFSERLEDYLLEPTHPSLIHGDLWTGNVLVKDGQISGFIDPAIYRAHREIELAFTTMFRTFGDAFFATYEALYPIEPDFHEVRCEIYNLYPALVHVRLFGASYLGGIERVLKRFGF